MGGLGWSVRGGYPQSLGGSSDPRITRYWSHDLLTILPEAQGVRFLMIEASRCRLNILEEMRDFFGSLMPLFNMEVRSLKKQNSFILQAKQIHKPKGQLKKLVQKSVTDQWSNITLFFWVESQDLKKRKKETRKRSKGKIERKNDVETEERKSDETRRGLLKLKKRKRLSDVKLGYTERIGIFGDNLKVTASKVLLLYQETIIFLMIEACPSSPIPFQHKKKGPPERTVSNLMKVYSCLISSLNIIKTRGVSIPGPIQLFNLKQQTQAT
ncbi:hypothetical protein Tco_0496996 [Tanacetum coccineum]